MSLLERRRRQRSRGFTLLELLMVTGILGVLAAIAIPLLQQAIITAQTKAVVSEGRTLHNAFKGYFLDEGEYPNASGSPSFELDTAEPLRSEGYYRGQFGARLIDEQADAYDSPDDQGTNQEFWLEMTLNQDATYRFLVADSDDSPLSGGDRYDGVHLFENGVPQNM